MLAEIKVAQGLPRPGEPGHRPWQDQPGLVHPDHIPSPPGSKPTTGQGEKPSPDAAASLQSDIEYGYSPNELEDYMGLTDCPEGCDVEMDGVCEHGWLSAAMTLGLV